MFDGHIRHFSLQDSCGSLVDQLLFFAQSLKPTIYGPKIDQKSVQNGQNCHYNGIYGFICLNDIIGGSKDSRWSVKVQGNTKPKFGPNLIVEVWLKMAKIGPNECKTCLYWVLFTKMQINFVLNGCIRLTPIAETYWSPMS